MLMVGELKPSNARMIVAALQGLKNGTPRLRVIPMEKSLGVLRNFSRSDNGAIATQAREILGLWEKTARH
jgi:hypothetical protein